MRDLPLLEHLPDLGIGDVSCILGTGMNGKSHWGEIPLEAWLIGLNGAVEIPLPWPLQLDARMVFDGLFTRLKEPWSHYEKPAHVLTILGTASSLVTDYCDYRFNTEVNLGMGGMSGSALEGEATVGGCALDLLRHCYERTGKPERVYLCGLDFGGGHYFNDYRCITPGRWSQAEKMNGLIADCQQRGMGVYTLSETELDVPYAD